MKKVNLVLYLIPNKETATPFLYSKTQSKKIDIEALGLLISSPYSIPSDRIFAFNSALACAAT